MSEHEPDVTIEIRITNVQNEHETLSAEDDELEVIERGGGLPEWGGMSGEIGADLGGEFEPLPEGF